jgi:hypothetical protein
MRRARKPAASNRSTARSSTTRRPRWCMHRRQRPRCWRTTRAFTSSARRAIAHDRARGLSAPAGFRSRPRHDARQRRSV